MQSFTKIKPSRNGKITLSFIYIGKSCLNREFFTSLICLLMLFAKIKFSESTVVRLEKLVPSHKIGTTIIAMSVIPIRDLVGSPPDLVVN